jgi:hypothetical protein
MNFIILNEKEDFHESLGTFIKVFHFSAASHLGLISAPPITIITIKVLMCIKFNVLLSKSFCFVEM